jgi:hypothetical protein
VLALALDLEGAKRLAELRERAMAEGGDNPVVMERWL